MIRGLYTSATGMGIGMLKQETITNNIANSSTVGYKKDTSIIQSFPDMLLGRLGKEIDKGNTDFVGQTNFGALVGETVTSFSDGTLEDTGNALNIALLGDGFFVVETPNGRKYTRDGNFRLDDEGYLVTQNGYRVQGLTGDISVGSGELKVTGEGQIIVDEQQIDAFAIIAFENPSTLQKNGQNLFSTSEQTTVRPSAGFSLHQNYLEKSNINLVEEMVELMTVVRAFETNQKLIQAQDEMLAKSVNEIGTLK